VLKGQVVSMEGRTTERSNRLPVERITVDWVTGQRQLRSNLMLPTGEKLYLQRGVRGRVGKAIEPEPSLFAILTPLHPAPLGSGAQSIHKLGPFKWPTDHHRHVPLIHRARGESATQTTRRLRGPREDDQPRDVPIEAVNEAQEHLPRLAVTDPDVLPTSLQQAVITGVSGLCQEPCRLIDDQEVIILEEDSNIS
jgi:hypothetical protein